MGINDRPIPSTAINCNRRDIIIHKDDYEDVEMIRKNTDHLNRREEVLAWVSQNDENAFVIIDDDKTLNKLPYNLKAKLVQPSATVGLNEELADNAIKILKSSERLAC